MKIERTIEKTYIYIQGIELRDGELESFLARQRVEQVDQLTKEDWEDIWASLEQSEEDDFTERVYDPTFFGNTDGQDIVINYAYEREPDVYRFVLYKEKENNNE